MQDKLPELLSLIKRAGQAILPIYQQEVVVTEKADASPLTEADMASHHCLVKGLKDIAPGLPCLSEESEAAEVDERMLWNRYWLIDPLDGTREFIRRNGEFTVNIALIEHGQPVLGLVYAPVLDIVYWGGEGLGAWRQQGQASPEAIHVSPSPMAGEPLRVVGSRSHQSEAFQQFMQRLPATELVSMGSSLKFCLVAEGRADLYPRLGPTSEWDTAAAQAVVEGAGGQVLDWDSMSPLRYNTRPDTLLNGWFVACARTDERWLGAVSTV